MLHHFSALSRARTSLALVVIAITLVSFTPASPSGAAGFNTPSTTSWPAWCPGTPSSLYDNPTQNSDVSQLFNGSIKGCFRVPDDRSSTLHVAWQSFVPLNDSPNAPVSTNGVSDSFTDGHFKLSLSTTNVHPGQHVTVIGRYISGHRPPNTESGILCWDGCQSGLQEEGQNLHWVSSTEFRTMLVVPSAPWFESYDGRASVHPLSSGTDTVGIECVTVTSGCATQAADTQVKVHLVAPKATWCTNTLPCGSLHVNSVHTAVGDVVEVRGRAPLVMLIDQPWGYWLEYSSKSFGDRVVSFHSPVTTETTATIAPKTLQVATGATWSGQRFGSVDASSWSWTYSVSPAPNGTSFVTCGPNAIATSGDGRTVSVPTASAGGVLVTHHLNVNGSKKAGACASAMVDPSDPSHVFASFYSAQQGVIPPSYLAGLYTTNDGATWHLVPTPKGHTSWEFGGFQEAGTGIAAVFMSSNSAGGDGASNITFTTEITTNGGASWSQSLLSCPNSRAAHAPCVIFGPSSPGNCAMNGQPESVYYGVPNEYRGGAIFKESRWITAVNACYSQELAATKSGTELLLDSSSIFPLVASRNGGRTWFNVQIPRLSGLGTGEPNSWLLIDSNGTLLTTASNNKGATSLYLLAPRASTWCRSLLLTKSFSTSMSPPRITGDDVFWSVTHYNESTVAGPSVVHVVAATSLHCQ
jgi:hypothetical protein